MVLHSKQEGAGSRVPVRLFWPCQSKGELQSLSKAMAVRWELLRWSNEVEMAECDRERDFPPLAS